MASTGRPTIYDVARSAGVSITTVSRVLNTPSQVNAETRHRVLTAVKALDYTVHAEARVRAQKDLGRIGILTPFFTERSFVERMHGVASVLANTKYELIVYSVESVEQREDYLDLILHAKTLDGLIVVSLPIADSRADALNRRGIRTICIEYVHPALGGVEIDNVRGGQLAVGFLLQKGYRRIAFVGETDEPPYSLHPGVERLAGFSCAMEDAGVEIPDEYVRLNPFSPKTIEAETRALLSARRPPEAVFVSSDIQAVHLMKTARAMNVRIPEDLGVIGFDNVDFADFIDLTTVDQGLERSGRDAAELLLSRIREPERASATVRLQLSIVERGTTAVRKGGSAYSKTGLESPKGTV